MAYPEPLPDGAVEGEFTHITDHNLLTAAVGSIDGRLHTAELAIDAGISAGAGYPAPWAPGEVVSVGDIRRYGSSIFESIAVDANAGRVTRVDFDLLAETSNAAVSGIATTGLAVGDIVLVLCSYHYTGSGAPTYTNSTLINESVTSAAGVYQGVSARYAVVSALPQSMPSVTFPGASDVKSRVTFVRVRGADTAVVPSSVVHLATGGTTNASGEMTVLSSSIGDSTANAVIQVAQAVFQDDVLSASTPGVLPRLYGLVPRATGSTVKWSLLPGSAVGVYNSLTQRVSSYVARCKVADPVTAMSAIAASETSAALDFVRSITVAFTPATLGNSFLSSSHWKILSCDRDSLPVVDGNAYRSTESIINLDLLNVNYEVSFGVDMSRPAGAGGTPFITLGLPSPSVTSREYFVGVKYRQTQAPMEMAQDDKDIYGTARQVRWGSTVYKVSLRPNATGTLYFRWDPLTRDWNFHSVSGQHDEIRTAIISPPVVESRTASYRDANSVTLMIDERDYSQLREFATACINAFSNTCRREFVRGRMVFDVSRDKARTRFLLNRSHPAGGGVCQIVNDRIYVTGGETGLTTGGSSYGRVMVHELAHAVDQMWWATVTPPTVGGVAPGVIPGTSTPIDRPGWHGRWQEIMAMNVGQSSVNPTWQWGVSPGGNQNAAVEAFAEALSIIVAQAMPQNNAADAGWVTRKELITGTGNTAMWTAIEGYMTAIGVV